MKTYFHEMDGLLVGIKLFVLKMMMMMMMRAAVAFHGRKTPLRLVVFEQKTKILFS